nr:sigma-54-dependent Fis family transcriptional regulator [Deltaproteobacteria bacterium]
MNQNHPGPPILLEKQVLIIDDEENMRHMLSSMLSRSGYRVDTASNGLEGLTKSEQATYDFILCDVKMPKMDGMAFLEAMQGRIDSVSIIMMSAYGTVDTAIEAMKKGAYDYISKPFKADEVYLTLKKAEERERLKRENVALKARIETIEEKHRFSKMVARSPKMQAVFQLAQKAAKYDTTVLITGESGTGKELIAQGIYFLGNRSKKPFVTINCGGIPETLLESELFGYRKGAFTGADQDKRGLFEEADQGTFFLDEIGEMQVGLQVKLLRVLQEMEIRPIGASKMRSIDVRIIAATSKNLANEIQKGRFREDLFYRLNVLPIALPPLRDRSEDILPLCRHFIDQFSKSLETELKNISPQAMSILIGYSWPGNVRELENAIERAMVLSEGQRLLLPEHFPPQVIESEYGENL